MAVELKVGNPQSMICIASATPDLWLPSQQQSLVTLGRYQVILLGDRHAC